MNSPSQSPEAIPNNGMRTRIQNALLSATLFAPACGSDGVKAPNRVDRAEPADPISTVAEAQAKAEAEAKDRAKKKKAKRSRKLGKADTLGDLPQPPAAEEVSCEDLKDGIRVASATYESTGRVPQAMSDICRDFRRMHRGKNYRFTKLENGGCTVDDISAYNECEAKKD